MRLILNSVVVFLLTLFVVLKAQAIQFELVSSFDSGPSDYGTAQFSSDANTLRVNDYYADKLYIWDLRTSNLIDLIQSHHQNSIYETDLSADGQQIAVLDRETLYIKNLENKSLHTSSIKFNFNVMNLKISPNGKFVAISAAGFDTDKYKIWVFDNTLNVLIYSYIGGRDFVFNPSHSHQFIHAHEPNNHPLSKDFSFVDLSTQKSKILTSELVETNWLNISANGQYFFNRTRPKIVDILTGKTFLTWPTHLRSNIFDKTKGDYLLGRNIFAPAQLLDVKKGAVLGPFLGSSGHGHSASCLQTSSDGKLLFVAGQGLTVFDILTQRELGHYPKVSGCVEMKLRDEENMIFVVQENWQVLRLQLE